MRRLTTLIKKNFKLVMRSKSSALIIILGPLLLMILVGAAFNTASVYGIRVGVYSESYSPLSEAIIHELNEKKYTTQKIETVSACTEGVKNGVFHVCAIFPKNLKATEGGNIEFYVDNSKTNLVYLITETISSNIGEKTKELSAQLTKGVVDTLEDVESEINDKEQLIKEMKEKNVKISETLSIINDDLIGLPLDYSINDFPFSLVKSSVGNTSTAASALSSIEKKVEELINELDKASSTRTKSVETLSKLKSDADANKVMITKIEYTFNTIKKNVDSVKETGVGNIVNPLKADIKPITSQKTHINFIFPTLMVMVIMFVSILLASTLEIREKTLKVYFKNFITPTSDAAFIAGNFITNIIIVMFQLLLLLGASYFFFREGIISTIHLLVPALLLITAFFIFIGIIIGNIFKTEETNAIASISLGFVLLFLSSAILPIEALPGIIKMIASFNPFYIGEVLLNKIILFQASFMKIWKEFALLGGYLVGAVVLTFIVKKMTKRRR